MKRALPLIVFLAACVPAGDAADEEDPAGGLEVSLAPSSATKGIPFVTSDGWTVTIDEVAVFAFIQATHTAYDLNGNQYNVGGGDSPGRLMVPGPACTMRAVDIEVGQGTVTVEIEPNVQVDDGLTPPCNVDPATLARFARTADNIDAFDPDAPPGLPNLIIRAHGTKDGHTVDLDLGLTVGLAASLPQPVTIIANEGIPVAYPFFAEVLLDHYSELGGVRFGQIANADADGDGHVTGAELEAASDPTCDSTVVVCGTFLDLIAEVNSEYLFGDPTEELDGG